MASEADCKAWLSEMNTKINKMKDQGYTGPGFTLMKEARGFFTDGIAATNPGELDYVFDSGKNKYRSSRDYWDD